MLGNIAYSFLIACGLLATAASSSKCPADIHVQTYFPHETDCGRFYQCSHGIPVLHTCPAGLHFNTKINVCDWPASANCTIISTTTTTTSTTTTTTKPAPSTNPPTNTTTKRPHSTTTTKRPHSTTTTKRPHSTTTTKRPHTTRRPGNGSWKSEHSLFEDN